jgi:hypothetical protein
VKHIYSTGDIDDRHLRSSKYFYNTGYRCSNLIAPTLLKLSFKFFLRKHSSLQQKVERFCVTRPKNEKFNSGFKNVKKINLSSSKSANWRLPFFQKHWLIYFSTEKATLTIDIYKPLYELKKVSLVTKLLNDWMKKKQSVLQFCSHIIWIFKIVELVKNIVDTWALLRSISQLGLPARGSQMDTTMARWS